MLIPIPKSDWEGVVRETDKVVIIEISGETGRMLSEIVVDGLMMFVPKMLTDLVPSGVNVPRDVKSGDNDGS